MKKAETNDDFNTMEDPTTASSRTCITSPRQSTDTANMSEEFGYLECSRPVSFCTHKDIFFPFDQEIISLSKSPKAMQNFITRNRNKDKSDA